MIYLDSSALVKLVVEEAESEPLRTWLRERSSTWASSELARVEVPLAVRKRNARQLPAAAALLSGLTPVLVGRQVLDAAAQLPDQHLRSLDAVHLASALALGKACTAFVAYDGRLLAAAGRAGLPTVTPA